MSVGQQSQTPPPPPPEAGPEIYDDSPAAYQARRQEALDAAAEE